MKVVFTMKLSTTFLLAITCSLTLLAKPISAYGEDNRDHDHHECITLDTSIQPLSPPSESTEFNDGPTVDVTYPGTARLNANVSIAFSGMSFPNQTGIIFYFATPQPNSALDLITDPKNLTSAQFGLFSSFIFGPPSTTYDFVTATTDSYYYAFGVFPRGIGLGFDYTEMIKIAATAGGNNCLATDVRNNTSTNVQEGIQYLSFPGTSNIIYFVYSIAKNPTRSVIIKIIPDLARGIIHVLGNGYGDTGDIFDNGAMYDAATDFANVDHVIKECLNLDPADLSFNVYPEHGHADHMNSAAYRAMDSLDYEISAIYYGAADQSAVDSQGWLPHHEAVLTPLPASSCGTQLASFPVGVDGQLYLLNNPPHTPGVVDAVFEPDATGDNVTLLKGSGTQRNCSDPNGLKERISPHGTIVLRP